MVGRSGYDFNLFRALEVFVAVAESGQITRAARLLGLTQSAASQQIHTLETAFGCPLFDRGARPIELTAAGVTLHRHAARIMADIEVLWTDVRRANASPRPNLRVGLLASIATTLTPCLTRMAHERFRIGEISLQAGLASDHQMLLVNRRVDLVVTSDAFYDIDGLVRFTLVREPFYLVVPADGPAAAMDFARLVEAMPMVRFSPAIPMGRRIDQHLRRVRLDLARIVEADRASMVVAAVAAGQGYSFLSPSLLVDGIVGGDRIVVRPMPVKPLTRTITLVARAGDMGEFAQVLAEALSGELRRVYEDKVNPCLPDGGRAIVYGAEADQ